MYSNQIAGFYVDQCLRKETDKVLDFLFTGQKMKFSIKNLFSKCDQIHSFLRIW